jgi:hypothetical protein
MTNFTLLHKKREKDEHTALDALLTRVRHADDQADGL